MGGGMLKLPKTGLGPKDIVLSRVREEKGFV